MKYVASASFVVLLSLPAAAQEVDFGAWCSEIARHPEERCIEQRPEDKAAYDSYADSVRIFEAEKIKRDESRRIESERVNRMGDVTADQTHDRSLGD